MMDATVRCPICLDQDTGYCISLGTDFKTDREKFDCKVCGQFELTRQARISYFDSPHSELTRLKRAALSHNLRSLQNSDSASKIVSMELVEHVIKNASLPNVAKSAANLIRLIGDHFTTTGTSLFVANSLYALVGTFDADKLSRMYSALERDGLIEIVQKTSKPIVHNGRYDYGADCDLTLAGWEKYEIERRGKFSSGLGFLAMKFGDDDLDPLVNKVIKPTIKSALNYELVDMRDITRAGVIDNIMRAQIRDSAFVIVDLTHDNLGAYWEAGYAEGLGKPVIYICKKEKFETDKTHFDTNHCTTVFWSDSEHDLFKEKLIATLRRSLNLFDS